MSEEPDSGAGGEAEEEAATPDAAPSDWKGATEPEPEADPLPRQAPFLRDEPDSLSEDAFGHRDYADALYSMVNDSSPPPTIGVFGPWGVGKSTIIDGLRRRLRGSISSFVYFDAWRYEGDSLRRQFLIDAAKQLKDEGKLKRAYKPEVELNELHLDRQEIKESLGLSLIRLLKAALIGVLFAIVGLILLWADVFKGVLSGDFGTGVLASVAAFTVGTFAGLFSQAIVIRPTTVTRRALQDPDRFAKKFGELLEALKHKRLVIAVDNLDRCAPEKAVEMLSTIKTYLEPSLEGSSGPRSGAASVAPAKEVVFVVSVDDAALRRHLVAQERQRSDDVDELAAGHYVDEYLAKFFNARLPIRSILPDDMRGYVGSQIRPLAEARGVPDKDTVNLIALVDAALRGNPRGVKQFYNDLEARLRLLEERERLKDGRRGIAPPVSPDVAMVAKLTLIEAEWPEAFARLQAEPRLLGRWSVEARTQIEVDWRPEKEIGSEAGKSDKLALANSRREFATFLRIAARTDSSQLRALLNLKQSAIEIELPGYADFRDALLAGDGRTMSEVMGEVSSDDRARLAAEVPGLLREEVKRGYLDSALAIVQMLVVGGALDPFETERREAFSIAVEEPELREQLTALDAEAVLAQGALLSSSERQKLFEPFIARFLDSELSGPARESLAGDLAPHLDDFNHGQRQQILDAISGELIDSFEIYLPFVRAEPSLLAAESLQRAIAVFESAAELQPDPAAPPRISQRADAWAVIEVALPGLSDPDKARTLEIANRTLRQEPDNSEALEADLPILAVLFERLDFNSVDFWATIAATIEELWNSFPAAQIPKLLELDNLVLKRLEDGPERAQRIAGQLFADPNHAFEVVDQLDGAPAVFAESFLNALEPLSADPALSIAALRAVERIDPTTLPERLLGAFAALLGADHLDAVRELLDRFAPQLEPRSAELAETATPILIARIEADQPGPADLLARLSEVCDEEEIGRLARAYLERLSGPQGPTVLQTLEELRAQALPRLTLLTTHYAVGRLDTEQPQPPDPLLSLAALNVDQLSEDQQEEFALILAQRLASFPDQAGSIANHVHEIRQLPARIAKLIADALISREESEAGGIDDAALRRTLLAAAVHIRVREGTLVTKALRVRAAALTASERPVDREIADSLRELLAG